MKQSKKTDVIALGINTTYREPDVPSNKVMPDLYECAEEFVGAKHIIHLKKFVLHDKVQDDVSAFMKKATKDLKKKGKIANDYR